MENSSFEEPPAELESQFILRLPEKEAHWLRAALRKGKKLKKSLAIYLDPETRSGEVRLKNTCLPGKLVDLPTIIESVKTIDKVNVCKTADICQMFVCGDEVMPIDENEKVQWPHGVAPSMKNVRRNRFRRVLRKKFSLDSSEVEKEVKWLLQIDNEAVAVRWELIKDDRASNVPAEDMNKEQMVEDYVNEMSELHVFGTILSDSEEAEEEEYGVSLQEI